MDQEATNNGVTKVKQDRDWQKKFREREALVNVSVLDVVEGKRKCSMCAAEALAFYVHCFREDNRPIKVLCKDCTITVAGGDKKVYVREAIGPGLRKHWEANRKVVIRSAEHVEAMQSGRIAARQNLPSR